MITVHLINFVCTYGAFMSRYVISKIVIHLPFGMIQSVSGCVVHYSRIYHIMLKDTDNSPGVRVAG